MTPVVRVSVFFPSQRGKRYDGTNATRARRLGEGNGVRALALNTGTFARRRHAAVAHLLRVGASSRSQRRIADEHAEAGLEGCDLSLPIVWGNIIHEDAAVGLDSLAGELRDAPVGAVAGAKIENRRPVVGEIFRESAASTRGGCRQVVCRRVHRGVEGVAADDLMEVGCRHKAGIDQRVYPISSQLRATEAHHREELAGAMPHQKRWYYEPSAAFWRLLVRREKQNLEKGERLGRDVRIWIKTSQIPY